MHRTRSMTREIGTAFAVLAIYLLTILAPLHHARASQLAFQELGYTTIDSGWVLCSAGETGGENRDVTVAKCPAAGIGKPDVAAPAGSAAAPTSIAARPAAAATMRRRARGRPAVVSPCADATACGVTESGVAGCGVTALDGRMEFSFSR